jgi:hypothetical protein
MARQLSLLLLSLALSGSAGCAGLVRPGPDIDPLDSAHPLRAGVQTAEDAQRVHREVHDAAVRVAEEMFRAAVETSQAAHAQPPQGSGPPPE